jgi:hypothetical protein
MSNIINKSMKYTYLITIIPLAGLLFSCGNAAQDNHDSSTTEIEATEEQSDQQDVSTEIKLSLNNGTKWNSDESTFTGMKRLELTLYNFNNDNKEPSIVDYNNLGIALANIDNDIISQCSMQGKDHDQLHVLLAPMLANEDVIKNGDDMLEIKVNTEALSEALLQFFEHFEVN